VLTNIFYFFRLKFIRATLELTLKHTLAEKKLEYDAFVRSQKDKEKDNKNLKKLELQLKAGQDSYMNIQLQYEKILSQVSLTTSKYRSILLG